MDFLSFLFWYLCPWVTVEGTGISGLPVENSPVRRSLTIAIVIFCAIRFTVIMIAFGIDSSPIPRASFFFRSSSSLSSFFLFFLCLFFAAVWTFLGTWVRGRSLRVKFRVSYLIDIPCMTWRLANGEIPGQEDIREITWKISAYDLKLCKRGDTSIVIKRSRCPLTTHEHG